MELPSFAATDEIKDTSKLMFVVISKVACVHVQRGHLSDVFA